MTRVESRAAKRSKGQLTTLFTPDVDHAPRRANAIDFSYAGNDQIYSSHTFARENCVMMASSSRQPRGGLASKTLKGMGLIRDEDASMRDLSRAGYKKTSKKTAHGHRQRAINIYKVAGSTDPQQKMVNTLDPFRSGHIRSVSGHSVSSLSL